MKQFQLVVLVLSLIASKSGMCQNITESYEASTQSPELIRDVVRVESVKTSTRSAFRVRSFMRTTPATPVIVTSEEEQENELSGGPIPKNVWIPSGLEFSCKGRAPGYYTDPSPVSKCQVYHMCMPDGRKYSMLCGIGTIFNQLTFVCDHWYNYRCADAESDYNQNNKFWDQFLSPSPSEEYDDDEETVTNPTTSFSRLSRF